MGGGKTQTTQVVADSSDSEGTQQTTQAAADPADKEETADTKAMEADASMYEVTEPITIQWWHSVEDQHSWVVEEVVNDFNNSQDLITVEPVYVGSYIEANEALVTAQAAGQGLPAVCVAQTSYLAGYGAGGLPEDLGPYAAATGYDLDDFSTGMLLASQYEGKQVSLPFLISTQAIYYNKDIAEAEGIEIPEDWSGMDEFLEKAAANGRTGLSIPGWGEWYFETFFLNNGLKIINDDQVSTDLGSETGLKLAHQFKDWHDKGWVYWCNNGSDASSNMRQSFIDGRSFAVCHTSAMYTTYVDSCDFEVGMAWLPGSDGRKNQELGGCFLLIPAKNDQATKNAAWQFLAYLCGKETNMKWVNATGYLPTRNSVLTTEEGEAYLAEKPAFQCIFDNLNLIYPVIQHSGWNQLATVWRNCMIEIMYEDVDVDEKIAAMAEEINEVLEDAAE